ncbi:MAG TPA: bifunctional SulP family inorganic anion transporter/carbonic anhydrase [Patescibacteria group bacterium]|nr:bifunctional SulP family inorganic anion transporter/carbonic anhydrase [Patescibacteria group bacterium]
MSEMKGEYLRYIKNDSIAGLVVFLVAVPLCLGIALASGAPLFSGLIAGIVGGTVVAFLSGSQTSVSGPAAGLAAVVLSAINSLGAFETFLLAVVIAGAIQAVAGLLKGGFIANYFPSSVINGLLVAIGVILILKQIPHALGYDADAVGEFAFNQPDGSNTFSEFLNLFGRVDDGATIIALISFAILFFWGKIPALKKSIVPPALIVVVLGVVVSQLFKSIAPGLTISPEHLVSVPVSTSLGGFLEFFTFPDFTQITNYNVYIAAFTIAIVASLETLLNLEAVDKMDPHKRHSPPNRELLAQGIGNMTAGLIGGLPITSVIVRSSVNIQSGGRTKMSAIIHGFLILGVVAFVPQILNMIPLSALAVILIMTGFKLASATVFKKMYAKGWNQFIPFMATVLAIVFTDLLIGIVIGLAVGIFFILKSNMASSFHIFKENHYTKEVIRIKLPQITSFLSKAAFRQTLEEIPEHSEVILDATEADFIDNDIMEAIRDFQNVNAPERNISLSLVGFKEEYKLKDHTNYVNVVTEEVQKTITPQMALEILKQGNERFVKNECIEKDFKHQMRTTAQGQYPMAAVLACIDSRTSTEIIFDLGLGDIFSVRLAGNVANEDVIGSLEFSCKVAGAKLIVVLGHTNCGAVKAACDHTQLGNITKLLDKIQPAINAEVTTREGRNSKNADFVMNVTKLNVENTMRYICEHSEILAEMLEKGEIGIVGGVYDVKTGVVNFTELRTNIVYQPSRAMSMRVN